MSQTKKESWLTSSWGVGIGTAIFSLILTMLYDYFKNKPLLSTIGSLLISVWHMLISALNFNIKVWWLLVGVVFLLIALWFISAYTQAGDEKPDFWDYKEDKFSYWKWSWEYAWNSRRNEWNIAKLNAHCPRCNTPLVEQSTFYDRSFNCPRCLFKSGKYDNDNPAQVELIILDNIKTGKRGV